MPGSQKLKKREIKWAEEGQALYVCWKSLQPEEEGRGQDDFPLLCLHSDRSTDPWYLEDRVLWVNPGSCKSCIACSGHVCTAACHGAVAGAGVAAIMLRAKIDQT